jgi:hypothetical protein
MAVVAGSWSMELHTMKAEYGTVSVSGAISLMTTTPLNRRMANAAMESHAALYLYMWLRSNLNGMLCQLLATTHSIPDELQLLKGDTMIFFYAILPTYHICTQLLRWLHKHHIGDSGHLELTAKRATELFSFLKNLVWNLTENMPDATERINNWCCIIS